MSDVAFLTDADKKRVLAVSDSTGDGAEIGKANIISIDTKNKGVRAWLHKINKRETHIYIAVVVEFKDDEDVTAVAEKIRNRGMLALRKVGYEQAEETVRPEKVADEECIVSKYVFRWSQWKKDTMTSGAKSGNGDLVNPNMIPSCGQLFR
jgi:hypothetical protein